MSPESLQPPHEEGPGGLKNLLDSLANRIQTIADKVFGPVREMGIPQEEIDKLLQEIRDNPHIPSSEVARKVYELRQKYPGEELPGEFSDFFKKDD
jgi:hypothetical protein